MLQGRKEVALRSDADERVHVRGAETLRARAEDVAELLQGALRLRRSEATERNPLSSRSHAVCVLSLEDGGSIRFVDLAGSERNYETRSMTAQQHRDFAEINKSLMALKVDLLGFQELSAGVLPCPCSACAAEVCQSALPREQSHPGGS